MQIRELSIDAIVGSVNQPRLQPLDRDRHRLVRSMLQNGMQVPIIVLREQGQHLLVSGHRRVDALQALRREGHKALPAGAARISRGKDKAHFRPQDLLAVAELIAALRADARALGADDV